MEENSLLKSLRRDVKLTAANYSQMYKRLSVNDAASRFFTTYYSACAIMLSLLPLFFKKQIASRQVLEFLLLSASIIVLIVSLMISFAKYSERSLQVMAGLNQMKRLKKELARCSDEELKADNYQKYQGFVARYHEIVDHIELRTDGDYYCACRALSTDDDCGDKWRTLSCSGRASAYLRPVAKPLFFLALFALPIVLVLVPGVIFK